MKGNSGKLYYLVSLAMLSSNSIFSCFCERGSPVAASPSAVDDAQGAQQCVSFNYFLLRMQSEWMSGANLTMQLMMHIK